MPEKVTSLNGLKVTSEYWSYNVDAHNKDYVKLNLKCIPFPRTERSTANLARIITGIGSGILRRRLPVASVWLMLPVASE